MSPRRLSLKLRVCLQALLSLCRLGMSWSIRGFLYLFSYIRQRHHLLMGDSADDNEGHLQLAIPSDPNVQAGVRRDERVQNAVSQRRTENEITLSCSSVPTFPSSVWMQDPEPVLPIAGNNPVDPCNQPDGSSVIGHVTRHPTASATASASSSAPITATVRNTSLKPLRPIVPSDVQHYEPDVIIKNCTGPWFIKPLEILEFDIFQKQCPVPWKYHVHPEGNPYFSYAYGTNSRRFRYLTEANVYSQPVRVELEKFMDALEVKALELSRTWRDVDAVLEFQDNKWCYYLIDLERQVVFWLDEYNLDHVLPSYQGVGIKHHLCHKLKCEYWRHIEYFPISASGCTEEISRELLDTLNFYHMDCVTSRDSTAPYSREDLMGLIESVRNLRPSTSQKRSDHTIVTLARMASIIEDGRYLNFYGFPGARLRSDQSVRGNSLNETSWLMKLAGLWLGRADGYLEFIESACVDGFVRQEKWEIVWKEFEKDWSGVVLNATVLLAATFSFMAVPNDLDDSWAAFFHAASALSSGANLMSIIIRFIQSRLWGKYFTMRYLEYRNCSRLSMDTLAILFGLPYALLVWGFYFFTIAFWIWLYSVKSNTLLVSSFLTVPLVCWVRFTDFIAEIIVQIGQTEPQARIRFGPVRQVIQPNFRRSS